MRSLSCCEMQLYSKRMHLHQSQCTGWHQLRICCLHHFVVAAPEMLTAIILVAAITGELILLFLQYPSGRRGSDKITR